MHTIRYYAHTWIACKTNMHMFQQYSIYSAILFTSVWTKLRRASSMRNNIFTRVPGVSSPAMYPPAFIGLLLGPVCVVLFNWCQSVSADGPWPNRQYRSQRCDWWKVYLKLRGPVSETTHHLMKQSAHNWHLPCRQYTEIFSYVSSI